MTPGTVIDVPPSAVVLLVGAAGSGKSTFARRHFPPDAILASDDLRAAITGDVADQSANGRVFAALHRALDQRLAAGRLAVVDATNVTAASRRAIRDRATRAGAPVIAIVFELPGAVVLARNATRPGRRVPDDVVERHLARLRRTLDRGALASEGYARIVVLRSADEVERTTVRFAPET